MLNLTKSQAGLEFDVQATTYHSHIQFLSREVTLMDRHQNFLNPTSGVETYASQHFLALALNLTEGSAIKSGNQSLSLDCGTAIYLPPNSLIEWTISAGRIRWLGIMSQSPLFQEKFESPMMCRIPLVENESHLKIEALLSQVRTAIRSAVPIIGRPHCSAFALRLKSFLDSQFSRDWKMDQIAQELGISRFTLTKEFSKSYGMSPTLYRSRVRVFEAIKLINCGFTLGEIAYMTGFSSPNRMTEAFRQHLGITPNQCDFQKKGYRRSSSFFFL